MEAGLIALAVLACPIGMGLMMWFMAKGMRGDQGQGTTASEAPEGSLAELKAEQARVGAEIERLEIIGDTRGPMPSASREGA